MIKMVLTPEEKFKIVSNIEYGAYSSQAALDNIERIVFDLTGIKVAGPRFNSKDVQILYNLIKTLEAKIENGD